MLWLLDVRMKSGRIDSGMEWWAHFISDTWGWRVQRVRVDDCEAGSCKRVESPRAQLGKSIAKMPQLRTRSLDSSDRNWGY